MRKVTLLLTFLVFVGMQLVHAQDRTINGTVKSAKDGSTLPGVSVVVKGTTIGTITDINGTYSIDVPASGKTLEFSFVGMKTLDVSIGASNVIDVSMEEDALKVDEVMVTAVGISREKKALGYSVQSVNAEEIERSNNTDLVNTLSAKTAGVQISSSSGTAGASTYMTIRGAASLEGNNQPLFVVDGVPFNTDQAWGGSTYETEGVGASSRSIDLNPEDIESVTVLKGGAATALYGVQAANGVVLITTKKAKYAAKGSTNNMKVKLSSSVTFDKLSQVPEMQRQYSQGLNGEWVGGYSGSWGANVDTLQYDGDPDYIWDPNGRIVGMSDSTANGIPVNTYDQFDFFQTGITYNNTLSVTNGTEKSTYYFSIGNLTQEGIIPNNTFNRTSIRFNGDTKLTDRLTTGANMSYINTTGNFIQQGSNISGVMLGLLRTPPTFDNSAGYVFADGSQRNYRNGGGYDNPYWTANMNRFDDIVNRFVGDWHLNYKLNDWAELNYKLGTDWYSRHYKDRFAINSRSFPSGYLEERYYFQQIINSDLMLNMHKDFSEDFRTRLTLGQNMYQNNLNLVSATANDLSIPDFYQINNTTDDATYGANQKYRTAALYADLQMDFKNMLYVGFTGRNEWATTMPADNLDEFYPSANVGFIFTELPGLKDNSILPFGKLRASWAKTANIADPYRTSTYYAVASTSDGWTNGNTFPLLGASGYTVSYLMGNPDLRHETMKSIEVGTELKFVNNRIGLDFAYFHNLNTDLLLEVPVASSSGFQNVYMNAAEMESKGFEISLYLNPVRTEDFNWEITTNFTKIENPVTKLAEGVDNLFLGGFVDPQIRAVVGQEYRSIFGYDWYRDENGNILINDDPTDGYPDGKPMTDDREMVSLGTFNPDYTMNIYNSFDYKGLGLSFLIDIKKGGVMYNGTRFTMNYFGTSIETINRDVVYNEDGTINLELTPAENLVVYEGVLGHIDANGNPVSSGVTNTQVVVNDQDWYRGQGGNFGGGPTSAAVEDASWFRLREITLYYNINPKALEGAFISEAQFYFTGRNLYLNTPYRGIDPETSLTGARNSQGMDYFNMPGTKAYTFGVKLTF